MKLLICASEYYPSGSGIANVVYNVVQRLEMKGINCTLCTPNGPDIKITVFDGAGRISLLQYWHKVYNMFKEDSKNYDVVWLHNPLFVYKNPFHSPLVTMHITSYGVYKKISQSREYPIYMKYYKKISSIIEQYSLKSLEDRTQFTAVSMQVLNELIKIGIQKQDIKYIPNGVDTNIFRPVDDPTKLTLRKHFGLPEKGLILLSTGSINIIKNPKKLINLFYLLEKTNENLYLVIAGKGRLREDVERLARSKGIKNIIFLGHIDYNEIHKLYRCADAYIISSIYEGLPLTLLEAMSSGLPCIVSNVNSIKSLVESANAGISIDLNNLELSADIVSNFLDGPLEKYASSARTYAVDKLDWDVVTSRYLDTFLSITDGNR